MYRDVIQKQLHDGLRGLKRSPGIDWLNDLLVRLDTAGLRSLVNSFVCQMDRQYLASGLLVELELADQLLRLVSGAAVSSDRQDGTAKVPCDITFELEGLRADFQCKAVLNSFNELWISEFMVWVRERFAGREPGLLLEFASVLDLTEDNYKNFRHWFEANEPSFAVGKTVEWQPGSGSKGIRIQFLPRSKAGIGQGVTWVAGPDYAELLLIDSDNLRQIVKKRIGMARRSFGYVPGPSQFNFVVVDISASPLYDEEDYFQSLFGKHFWTLNPDRSGLEYGGYDGSGVYFHDKPDWVSGVIFVKRPEISQMDYLIYPHPDHIKAVESNWIKTPFRWGKIMLCDAED